MPYKSIYKKREYQRNWVRKKRMSNPVVEPSMQPNKASYSQRNIVRRDNRETDAISYLEGVLDGRRQGRGEIDADGNEIPRIDI